MVSSSAGMGIIPADAGSTTDIDQELLQEKDHPRGCGEHKFNIFSSDCRTGSSPRMRGALRGRQTALPRRGIIPADAGSTQVAHRFWERIEDHPRGCGEHTFTTEAA